MHMATRKVGISLVGCGAVGSGVLRILEREGEALSQRTGLRFEVRRVLVRDPKKPRDVSLPSDVFCFDPEALFGDAGCEIIIEAAGGLDIGRTGIECGVAAGKDVVTANKALLALHGSELFAVAREAGRCIAFEASVAGGIPVIQAVRRGLIGNRIDAIYGILNGTCNFILTTMLAQRVPYEIALQEAQRLGYAEADPTLDVGGMDSAHKLAILASIAMRERCEFERIQIRGVAELAVDDLLAARELGYVCKLLASATHHDDGLDMEVQPTFVAMTHPLASVMGPFNAVSVYGDAVGHTLYYGRGAGGVATASAIVADLVDVATGNARQTFYGLRVLPDQTQPPRYRPAGENASRYYIRIDLKDRPGGIGKVASCLGEHGINIAAVMQHEHRTDRGDGTVPVIVTTRMAKKRVIEDALEEMAYIEDVVGTPVAIPVFNEFSEQQET